MKQQRRVREGGRAACNPESQARLRAEAMMPCALGDRDGTPLHNRRTPLLILSLLPSPPLSSLSPVLHLLMRTSTRLQHAQSPSGQHDDQGVGHWVRLMACALRQGWLGEGSWGGGVFRAMECW